MTIDWANILLAPLALSVVMLFLGWASARSISAGRPLDAVQRGIVVYGALFVLGMGYSMSFVFGLRWLRPLWIVFTVTWAALLAASAWWWYKRRNESSEVTTQLARHLRIGLPLVGLLVSAIGLAAQFTPASKGDYHWFIALLWGGAVVGMIAIAGRNRRLTIVYALRTLLGLSVVSAIVLHTLEALLAVLLLGATMFLVEQLWRHKSTAQ